MDGKMHTRENMHGFKITEEITERKFVHGRHEWSMWDILALSYWIEDYRDYKYALQVLKCCGYGILGIMINWIWIMIGLFYSAEITIVT